jgi:hypothetical protein
MELWHNPRCSKSRSAKAILDERGVAYEERRYVDDPPTAKELDAVLVALGREPWDIARMGEPVAKDLGLRDWPHDRRRWIDGGQPDPDRAADPGGRGRPGRARPAAGGRRGPAADDLNAAGTASGTATTSRQ